MLSTSFIEHCYFILQITYFSIPVVLVLQVLVVQGNHLICEIGDFMLEFYVFLVDELHVLDANVWVVVVTRLAASGAGVGIVSFEDVYEVAVVLHLGFIWVLFVAATADVEALGLPHFVFVDLKRILFYFTVAVVPILFVVTAIVHVF